jgi:uncharacterized membrane protein
MDEPVSGSTISCPACRVLDRADGVEDGKLYKSEHYPVGNERRIVAAIKRSEDRVADRVTAFAGSLNFVYIHTAWFAVWIAINAGLVGASAVFDKFPYGLLTMVVSLEAIFLATFVMVSQNRQAARSDIRSDLDFENNLRSEIWSVHIGEVLGLDAEHVESVVRAAIDGYRAETRAGTARPSPAPNDAASPR